MTKAGKSKPHTRLWWVGIWATWWWALSCLWFVGLLLYANDYYITRPQLIATAGVIVAGWIIGAIVWIRALKKAKISTKAGLKDLFLTIRR